MRKLHKCPRVPQRTIAEKPRDAIRHTGNVLTVRRAAS